MECGLQLPWRKHYSVLDFLTSCAFLSTDPEEVHSISVLPVIQKQVGWQPTDHIDISALNE